MMRYGLSTILFMVATVCLGASSCEEQEIVVANEGFEFPPFSSFKNGNEFQKVGFEVEIFEAIKNRLPTQYKAKFVHRYESIGEKLTYKSGPQDKGPIDWGDLLDGLYVKRADGKSYAWDVAMSTFGITEERKKKVDFSIPYFKQSKHFFGNAQLTPINTLPDDLNGRTVAVEKGTLFQEYVQFLNTELAAKLGVASPIKILVIESDSAAPAFKKMVDLLVTGQIDFFVQDDEVFEEEKKVNPDLALFSAVGSEATAGFGGDKLGEGVGIAFRKNSEITKDFDKALKEMFDSCAYHQIYKKYFVTESPLDPEHCK
jgi:arginine/lysine/histidine transporter system substrate-binding protein